MFTLLLLCQWYASYIQCIAPTIGHEEILDHLTVNDIRNGIRVYVNDNLHNHYFNPQRVKFVRHLLQCNHPWTSRLIPNPILQITDIPERCQHDIDTNVSYPAN